MRGPICDTCGKVHMTPWSTPACRAHLTPSSERAGEPCTKAPIKGGYVCRSHGGAVRNQQRAAELRLALMSAQGEIAELMSDCDIPDQDPTLGLLEAVRVSGSMMRMLTLKVGELKEEPDLEDVLVEGKNGELSTKKIASRDAFWGYNKDGEMVPHPYVTLLKTWTERYEKACSVAISCGIAERQVKLAENQAELLAKAVKAILVGLNLTDEQWELAPTVVESQLRMLTA